MNAPAASLQPRRIVGLRRFRRRAVAAAAVLAAAFVASGADFSVLKADAFAHHVQRFNAMDDETVTNFISNAQSWNWLQQNIPLFECPDGEVEEIYYFRWWSFRKHVVQTTNGFVLTEFLTPVKHAGAFNTISCAAGFHLAEGRWLRDDRCLDDYTRFWLRSGTGFQPVRSSNSPDAVSPSYKPQPHFHKYSSWFAAAVWDRYLVNGDRAFVTNLLDDLVADYRVWEAERRLPDGLFWQYDVRDGMEESISGSRTNKNVRPTINSYMFANARAMAEIARLAKRRKTASEFDARAAELKRLVQEKLWNPAGKFFETRREDGTFANVREAIGFIPWVFDLPDPKKGFDAAWTQFADPRGFSAPAGLTTAERRHPQFRSHGAGKCEWDGAVWPFATSQTLAALANVLRDRPAGQVSRRSPASNPRLSETGAAPVPQDFFSAFLTYIRSQRAGGEPYIGEYLDEVTGAWINGKNDRSRYYNHSTFADLLITGVIGLRPRADDVVEISPLLPPGAWDWFCLDGVRYHGRTLTIFWDKDGSRYGRGRGLILLVDGREVARAAGLSRLSGKLP